MGAFRGFSALAIRPLFLHALAAFSPLSSPLSPRTRLVPRPGGAQQHSAAPSFRPCPLCGLPWMVIMITADPPETGLGPRCCEHLSAATQTV